MISAALITPGGDPVSLCILTIPLYFLFEISILIGTMIERRHRSEDSQNHPSYNYWGSLFLLFLLLLCGIVGGWLYFNWDRAESFLLQLDPLAKEGPNLPLPKTNPIEYPRNILDSSQKSFIIELNPILEEDSNESVIRNGGTFEARIKRH